MGIKRSAPKYKAWITESGLLRLRGWARDGLTQQEIAKRIGVVHSTLSGWRGKYPEINAALEEGSDATDRRVEGALLKRALGYDFTERKTLVAIDKHGTKTQRVEEAVKHVPGDPTAQIFWLKNRKPREWRDKREMELMGEVGLVQIVDDIPVGTDGDASKDD
jgi:transcriptional regulator with XRE-family HTH domain